MSGMLVTSYGVVQAKELGSSRSVKEAFSPATRELVDRIQALRTEPSPASLRTISPSVRSETGLQDQLFNALAAAKMLAAQVAMHMDPQWRTKLFRQLDSLHDIDEWPDGDQPLRSSSFTTFLKALLSINPERWPGLGLSGVGNLIAAWTTEDDRLTIEFLPHERVRWVLSRRYGNEIDRLSGTSGIARLAEALASYHPEHWFTHAKTNLGTS